MKKRKQISAEEAKRIGESLHIDWGQVDLEQFQQDLMGNHKQRSMDLETELTYDSVLVTGRLIVAHMQDFPDYFHRLEKLRAEINEYKTRSR